MTGKLVVKRANSPRSTRQKPGIYVWLGILNVRVLVFASLLVLAMLSGIAVVYSTHQNRYVFSELQQLKNQHNDLQVQWWQLLIEQSTFAQEGRIEKRAVEELQMILPEITDVVMVKYD